MRVRTVLSEVTERCQSSRVEAERVTSLCALQNSFGWAEFDVVFPVGPLACWFAWFGAMRGLGDLPVGCHGFAVLSFEDPKLEYDIIAITGSKPNILTTPDVI